MDTLAVRLIVPLAGPKEDFHLQVTPCGVAPVMALRAMPGAQKDKTGNVALCNTAGLHPYSIAVWSAH